MTGQPLAVEARRWSGNSRPALAVYLAGLTADLVGDFAWLVGLSWAAAQAGGVEAVSVVLTVGEAPRALLILLAGGVVDRVGAVRVAQSAQVGRIVVMAAISGLALTGTANVAVLAAAACLFGVLDAGRMPASASLPVLLFGRERIPALQTVIGSTSRLASVAGSALGGLVVAATGLAGAALLNLTLFAASFVSIVWLGRRLPFTPRPHPPGAGSHWAEATAGFAYAWRHRVLGLLVLTIAVLNLVATAPLNVGFALRAQQEGWGAGGLGWLTAVYSAGAGLSGLAVSVARRHLNARLALGLCALNATALLAFGAKPGLPYGLLLALALGATVGPASSLLTGLAMRETDPEVLGRVTSLMTFASFGLTPLSFPVFGLLTSAIGLVSAFALCGGAQLAVVIAVWATPVRHLGAARPLSEPA